jgi:hypothetical protein
MEKMMQINKDKALFWLNRRIRELETKFAEPNQEEMAKAGISYGDRQALMERRSKEAEGVQGELSSLKEVVAFINEKA